MEIRQFGNGFLVYYMGEDIYFDNLRDAEVFIEEHFHGFKKGGKK